MTRVGKRAQRLSSLLVSLTTTVAVAANPPAVTGEVRALDAQPIYTPPTNGGAVIQR